MKLAPDERWALWTTTNAALWSCFPERARVVSAELEEWLEPGPWSLEFKPEEKSSLHLSAVGRDRLRAEIDRAVSATDPQRRDAHLSALDRWLAKSFAVSLCARLGLFNLSSPEAWQQKIFEWLDLAGELQVRPPSLAAFNPGVGNLREVASRLARELGIDPTPERAANEAIRSVAREIIHGRIDRELGAARLTALGADSNERIRLLLSPGDLLPRATLELARRILGRAAPITDPPSESE